MTGWIAHEVLSDLGFDDDQVAELNQAKVDLLHVAATIEALQPRFARLAKTFKMILQVANKE